MGSLPQSHFHVRGTRLNMEVLWARTGTGDSAGGFCVEYVTAVEAEVLVSGCPVGSGRRCGEVSCPNAKQASVEEDVVCNDLGLKPRGNVSRFIGFAVRCPAEGGRLVDNLANSVREVR